MLPSGVLNMLVTQLEQMPDYILEQHFGQILPQLSPRVLMVLAQAVAQEIEVRNGPWSSFSSRRTAR